MTTNISEAFPAIEHAYITQKAMQWEGDFARLNTLVQAFVQTADKDYLTELNSALVFLASPDSPLQRELAYITSKI